MTGITFHIVKPNDEEAIKLIAGWYLSQWNIPESKTIEKLQLITKDRSQFQVLMKVDDIPVATGGLYNHVGLIDKEPRFKIYKNWMALIYTIPSKRQQGFGALICNYIQGYSKHLGVSEIFLYTDTAERLYTKLGWSLLEKLPVGERNIVIMKKAL